MLGDNVNVIHDRDFLGLSINFLVPLKLKKIIK